MKAVSDRTDMALPTQTRFSTDSTPMATDNSAAKSFITWSRNGTDTILLAGHVVTIDRDHLALEKAEENFDPTIETTVEVPHGSEGLRVRNLCETLVID